MGLEYKIVGRRRATGDMFDLDHVDVEWTHTDGPIVDYVMVPVTHPPDIKYERRIAGHRQVVPDQISVKPGTKDSIVMQMLEEKKEQLAKSLGVEP